MHAVLNQMTLEVPSSPLIIYMQIRGEQHIKSMKLYPLTPQEGIGCSAALKLSAPERSQAHICQGSIPTTILGVSLVPGMTQSSPKLCSGPTPLQQQLGSAGESPSDPFLFHPGRHQCWKELCCGSCIPAGLLSSPPQHEPLQGCMKATYSVHPLNAGAVQIMQRGLKHKSHMDAQRPSTKSPVDEHVHSKSTCLLPPN